MGPHESVEACEPFLELSVILTGFERVAIIGTGLVETYLHEVTNAAGAAACQELWAATASLVQRFPQPSAQRKVAVRGEILVDAKLGPVARAIVKMWYLGRWEQLPPAWRQQYGVHANDQNHVISAEAYKESLVWRAFGVHPFGGRASGFATWSQKPGSREG